jgi:pseudouridine-5'-monophosphatase
VFPLHRRVLGDGSKIHKGRGKPNPDICLLALKVTGETLEEEEEKLRPKECLVFDAVPDAIVGKRARMRVVWVSHSDIAVDCKRREGEVLAGKEEKDGYDSDVCG